MSESPPYDPFSLSPTEDGSSRFLRPFTPADGFSGNQSATSPAHSALLSLTRIWESRREELCESSVTFGEFQLRRIVRLDESGEYEARPGKRVRAQQIWTRSRAGKFARLEFAGKSGLLDQFFLGEIDWSVARDEDVWHAAVALVTDSKPAPSAWVLIELSGLINRVLAARAGIDLGLNVDA